MKKCTSISIISSLVVIILAGCSTPNPYGNSYASTEAQISQEVSYGTIKNITPVTINTSTTSNAVGSVAGALIGGILGSKVGGGRGTDIAKIGGGLLGGYAGSQTAQILGKTNGVNLTIALDKGRTISVVQAADPKMIFRVGQAVQINQIGGKTRVTPR